MRDCSTECLTAFGSSYLSMKLYRYKKQKYAKIFILKRTKFGMFFNIPILQTGVFT
jgi:hypothetical protein